MLLPLLLGLALLAGGRVEAAPPIEVTDDTGVTVRLDKPATRVIALYGAFSELLLALDARELLAARTVADARLPELAGLPAVGTHMRPNVELIVARRPDIVLQLAGRREALLQTEALRGLGVNVLTFEMDSFEKMFAVLEKLGRLTGRERQAAGLLRNWSARLAALRARNAGRKPPRVFYEARYPNLLAAGRGSIVNEIIVAAGGENVVDDDKKLARFNEEALIRANPDAYLIQKGPMNPDPQPLTGRAHYRALRAVRAGRVLVVDESRFARPGPASVEAAEELEKWLHPSDEREKQ
ncbi:ABC transporter substrate-binding protein [Desulfovibrio sp. SGI.169]|uniref:ABC transporter substrate-binding protein n=1 Tax=Desulfovibrio sp. SGI.169 TaxID=3420561 RepID=UPI003CFC1C0F